MAWRFQPDGALANGFRRIAAEEIAKIRAELDGAAEDPARAVHQTRRRLKRLRALLRLARPALGSSFPKANRHLRDLGRKLALSRDAAVLTATFDDLVRQLGAAIPLGDVEALRNRIRKRSGGDPTAACPGREIDELRAGLDKAERDLEHLSWPMSAVELTRGFRQSQSRLRRSWQTAREGDADAVHEWRKRLKHQLTQVALLRTFASDALRARQKLEKLLAEKVGEDRDLLLLQQILCELVPTGTEASRDAIVEEIARRREKLRSDLLQAGEELASLKPRDLAEEVLACWEARSRQDAQAERRHRAKANEAV
jgi:CHAD domain-containing protein